MPCHVEPQQLSPAVPHNQERKQEIKGHRRHNAHINSGNRLSVISKKCLPGLRRRVANSHHVFRDRRLGDFEPELEQFAVDTRRAPKRILHAHPLDQITQAPIDLGTPCPISRPPPPKHLEASAMPPQDGLRLKHVSRITQARPELGHPYEQRAITAMQSKTRRCPPQSNVELMAKKQVLSLKSAPRLKQVDDEHSERAQNRKNRFQ